MTASESTSRKGQERAESEHSADITHGDHGSITGDCGQMTAGGVGTDVFLPPSESVTVEIEAQTGEDSSDDEMVSVWVRSGSDGARLSQRFILSQTETEQLAGRLEAAAAVLENNENRDE